MATVQKTLEQTGQHLREQVAGAIETVQQRLRAHQEHLHARLGQRGDGARQLVPPPSGRPPTGRTPSARSGASRR